LAQPLNGLSLAEVAERATGAPVAPDAQFEVAGLDWVEFAACGCAKPTPVGKFVPRTHKQPSRCPKCAAPLVPLSFYTHRTVGAAVLGSAVSQPLRKLGARHVQSVVVRNGETGALVRQQPATQE
jgi:hypothetical protein